MTLKKSLLRNVTAEALATGIASAGQADDGFYLKDGDRVVFYGDSITDQRLYTTFVETYVVTRFPWLHVDFFHSGWSGDRVTGGGGGNVATRLERDVFVYRPTVMTIMLGMNDGSYHAFDPESFKTFETGLRSIVDNVQTKFPGIRLTLIEPSPFDDVTREPKFAGGYNSVMIRYGEAAGKIAQTVRQNVADLNGPVVAMLEKARAADPALACKIINDRAHPGPAGHLIMAKELLKSWNAPAIVSEVEIDARATRVTVANNTAVSDLKVTPETIEWSQLDRSLPMPVALDSAETALPVDWSDFFAALDRQSLRVTGLPATGYDLLIDEKKVGWFSLAEFSAGVNLATLATPMAAQAAEVHQLTLSRAEIHNIRWRSFQVPFAEATGAVKEHLPTAMSALDTAEREAAAMQRADAQPVPHRFKLVALEAAEVALRGVSIDEIPATFGTNLALNKPWKSSAPNLEGHDVGLTDGVWTGAEKNTYWTDDQDTGPKTVTVDLGEPVKVGRVVTGVPAYGSTCMVEVSVSTDGASFHTVGRCEFAALRNAKRLFVFEPTAARYVRLAYLSYHDTWYGYPLATGMTTDLQVFGPAAYFFNAAPKDKRNLRNESCHE